MSEAVNPGTYSVTLEHHTGEKEICILAAVKAELEARRAVIEEIEVSADGFRVTVEYLRRSGYSEPWFSFLLPSDVEFSHDPLAYLETW